MFERHFVAVHRYAQQRVGLSAADEIAAETFLVAFDRRRRYDGGQTSARPWLLGIATNLVRHHWRAERRKLIAYARTVAREPAAQAQEASSPPAPPFDAALAEALRALAAEDRDALLLFVWADLSYEEIAEALGVPIGTVRSRISRARRRLREHVGSCLDGPSSRPIHFHAALTEEIHHG